MECHHPMLKFIKVEVIIIIQYYSGGIASQRAVCSNIVFLGSTVTQAENEAVVTIASKFNAWAKRKRPYTVAALIILTVQVVRVAVLVCSDYQGIGSPHNRQLNVQQGKGDREREHY